MGGRGGGGGAVNTRCWGPAYVADKTQNTHYPGPFSFQNPLNFNQRDFFYKAKWGSEAKKSIKIIFLNNNILEENITELFVTLNISYR